MRLVVLYLRSRMTGRAAVVLLAIALTTWLWASWTNAETITVTLLPLAMPLAAAAVIGATTASPFGESERTASHPIAPLRLGHLLGLLGLALLTLALAVTWWSVPAGAWTLARNLAGFTGLGLLTARLLGSGLSWVIPLGWTVLTLLIPPSAQPIWAWAARAATDHQAAVIAIAMLALGLGLIASSGARDRISDII